LSSEGSFDVVAGVTFVISNGTSPFSLQLNTNPFTTPTCNGAATPSACQGWQQFIFSDTGVAFIQYWLLNYVNACPSEWNSFGSDCWTNGANTVSVPVQPIANLAHLTLTGVASGFFDEILFGTGDDLYTASNPDNMLYLAQGWQASEFNIFGDCCGSKASFNTGATVGVMTGANNGTSNALACSTNGFTGETNNLTLVQPCCPIPGVSPAIVFTESDIPGIVAGRCHSLLAAAWHPNSTQANVFYVGASGQLYNWYWTGSMWANAALGAGEPAVDGTGLAVAWHPDGTQVNVFYVGANGQIYNWYLTGSKWANAALGAGEPAASNPGLAVAWHPNGTQVNVFYVGANGQIYNWYLTGSKWANAALGAGEPAVDDTGLAVAWHPNGTQVNVFYVGHDGQIYNWYWTGSKWANSALGKGALARGGSGLAAAWHPDGTQVNVFYVGQYGQIYNWYLTGSMWTNSALGAGEPAASNPGLAMFWHPNGTQVNVFYVGQTGQIYNWYWTGSKWANSQL
jgi:hypothetical protein